jgi:8-amino-7-oxononanoate synthase
MLDRMKAELARLQSADQFRELVTSRGIPLGSNDYLGLSTHPRLRNAIALALEKGSRFSSTGSRLLSGNDVAWEGLETDFARFAGSEAALYFPSGYAANIGLLSSILKPGDTVFSDASNHASMIDGIRLSRAGKVIFPHLDLGYLEDALRRHSTAGRKVVVVESIFSMEGDHAPLGNLVELCNRYDASLVVDAAHSVGVEGQVLEDAVLATVNTCGKALASMGAFVTGSRTLREYLINHARTFIFSTALPSYCAAHVREAMALASEADAERSHLRALGHHLRGKLRASGFDIGRSDSQIVPLILGANEAALRAAARLSDAGFAIRAIRPPTVPVGTARLRISLNANLSISDIDHFVETIVALRETELVR